eukprot:5388732-Alexandrium_andersonii.AAC.1
MTSIFRASPVGTVTLRSRRNWFALTLRERTLSHRSGSSFALQIFAHHSLWIARLGARMAVPRTRGTRQPLRDACASASLVF